MDVMSLSTGEEVKVNIDDFDYNEYSMSSDFLVMIVFEEEEFSFTYTLLDNEEVSISTCADALDLFEWIYNESDLSEEDAHLIQDSIESEIRLVAI